MKNIRFFILPKSSDFPILLLLKLFLGKIKYINYVTHHLELNN